MPVPDQGPDVGFSFPIVPRYAEIDQQGVVFNAHYLVWFDEAFNGFLDHVGLSYPDFVAQGHDVQVVHTEIDFVESVRARDGVRVVVSCEGQRNTSFTVGFTVLRHTHGEPEHTAVRGRNVYVVVSASDWTKRPIPQQLREALSATQEQE